MPDDGDAQASPGTAADQRLGGFTMGGERAAYRCEALHHVGGDRRGMGGCRHEGPVERVDEIVATAVANGGGTYDSPQDLGFIYTHGFVDADGNVWRLNYFDPNVPLPGQ